jgi:hypothetical protein
LAAAFSAEFSLASGISSIQSLKSRDIRPFSYYISKGHYCGKSSPDAGLQRIMRPLRA